jgi:hypothetical protein
MIRYQPFKVTHRGQSYSATWHVEDGRLVISSAYGSDSAMVGGSKPDLLAEKLFKDVLAKRG